MGLRRCGVGWGEEIWGEVRRCEVGWGREMWGVQGTRR